MLKASDYDQRGIAKRLNLFNVKQTTVKVGLLNVAGPLNSA